MPDKIYPIIQFTGQNRKYYGDSVVIADAVLVRGKTQKANPHFAPDYKFSPAEWIYENEGAEDQFNAICSQLTARLDEVSADESAFEACRNELFATCFRVLRTLKTKNFFEATAGGPVILLFVISDWVLNEHE